MVFTGPFRVIVIFVPIAVAGRIKDIALLLQQETTFRGKGVTTLFIVALRLMLKAVLVKSLG
jgi:hypothetical protein